MSIETQNYMAIPLSSISVSTSTYYVQSPILNYFHMNEFDTKSQQKNSWPV